MDHIAIKKLDICVLYKMGLSRKSLIAFQLIIKHVFKIKGKFVLEMEKFAKI